MNVIRSFIVFLLRCCLKGCISVLYWFSEIVVSVRVEDVVKNVVVVGRSLYNVSLSIYVFVFLVNIILSGMLMRGVSKL